MFRNRRLPKVIITRNGSGNLCLVITRSLMRKSASGFTEFNKTNKLFPEIQWPQAWKPVKCEAKDAVVKLDDGKIYVWSETKNRWTDTRETACLGGIDEVGGSGLYYLEYIKTVR